MALCVGVASLLCDFFNVSQPHVLNVHLLFGATVSAVVTACLVHARRALAQSSPHEFYQYAQRVARWTYILMYVLALVRVALYLLEMQRASGSAAPVSPAFRAHSLDDFQIYVAYCVVPLWLVRALVLAWPVERTATSVVVVN